MKLIKVKTLDTAREIMIDSFKDLELETEIVNIDLCTNRFLASDVESRIDVPHFDRSVVDGYAVNTSDIQGASESIPAILKLAGQAEMGEENEAVLGENECMYVPTGGMMPEGADAMVMIEYTEKFSSEEILIYKNASTFQHILKAGDDIKKNEEVFTKGKKLYPQDIGALASIGELKAKVFKKPRISILSTGDEIVSPETEPEKGSIRDINSYSLASKITSWGGEVVERRVLRDDYDLIKESIIKALEISDAVFVSGGSSVGEKDYTLPILEEIEGAEILINGLNVKPGKPTIIAKVKGKPIIGLPGQPASAYLVLMQMLDIIYEIYYKNKPIKEYIIAKLDQNIASAPGRKTLQMVSLKRKGENFTAEVLRGKSGMISLISKSYGYVVIGENSEGKEKGETVKVFPLV